MNIEQEIIINKGVDECWNVIGVRYTEIYKWASIVYSAEGDGVMGINGASCDIRGCNVEGMGDIEEKLTDFDPENHYLAYTVTKGLPGMMKEAKNSWKLTSLGSNKTRLNMKGTIVPKGLAKLMKPMIKMQFSSMTKKLVEEFKYFVENGVPHPRKLKADKKAA
ncbi:MAG: SRPBCC family protein [Cyclobacteriaceae bacterium]|nr:SRPBCC family protein [Cyclobacteriaceae bacterium HetDA_MAG_MS6]